MDTPSKFMSYDVNIEGEPHDLGSYSFRQPKEHRARLVIVLN